MNEEVMKIRKITESGGLISSCSECPVLKNGLADEDDFCLRCQRHHIGKASTRGFPYWCTLPNEETGFCRTCKVKIGRPRVDKGLKAGTHCDECWKAMVEECRSRSW